MTLLEYALSLCDQKLAVCRVVEQQLATLEAETAAIRRRLEQQKQALLDESNADRSGDIRRPGAGRLLSRPVNRST
jgi:hypothetical protein